MARPHPETALLPYLRGELAPVEGAEVARHLEGCADCRRDVERLRALIADLGHAIPPAPPVHWGRYRAELRERIEARRRRAWWWRPAPLGLAGGLAAALLVLAVLGLPERGGREPFSLEEALIGGRLELLHHYALVERLDLLENLELIRQLDQLQDES